MATLKIGFDNQGAKDRALLVLRNGCRRLHFNTIIKQSVLEITLFALNDRTLNVLRSRVGGVNGTFEIIEEKDVL